MNPTIAGQQSSRSSAAAGSSSLRPRTRRLISGFDEDTGTPLESGPSTRAGTPLESSRAASPIPNRHPSRSISAQRGRRGDNGGLLGGYLQTPERDSSVTLTGLWGNSWSTLQGLASSVLGNETEPLGGERSPKRSVRKPPTTAGHRRTPTSHPGQWGPPLPTEAHIATGPKQEREALVRQKKRENLLAANGDAYMDAVGRFKRRTSEDKESTSAPPHGHGEDALVYIHNVRPQDTVAGIAIRYNCQQAVLRKSNRMWPNDTVQFRKTIVLPVDACGVKGKRVDAPATEDLLFDETPTNGPISPDSSGLVSSLPAQDRDVSTSKTASMRPPSSSAATDTETLWTHDSWVLLSGDSTPTEIARMPRRTLGYFPPARRKSQSYSDMDTPRASLDLFSQPYTDTQTLAGPSHHQQSPSAGPGSRRGRGSSTSSSAPQSYFPPMLQGPGGVGTMGKNVTSPGPAPVKMEKILAPYLPNVAPPPGFNPAFAALNSPFLQQSSDVSAASGSAGTGLENIGGAIEGWMRKVATKAATALTEPGPGGKGRKGGFGDLIEMADASEVGAADDYNQTVTASNYDADRGRRAASSSGSQDAERMLGVRDRAGRSTSTRAIGGKAGKGD